MLISCQISVYILNVCIYFMLVFDWMELSSCVCSVFFFGTQFLSNYSMDRYHDCIVFASTSFPSTNIPLSPSKTLYCNEYAVQSSNSIVKASCSHTNLNGRRKLFRNTFPIHFKCNVSLRVLVTETGDPREF
eukprot:1094102_1